MSMRVKTRGEELAADVARASARTYEEAGEEVLLSSEVVLFAGWSGLVVPGMRRVEDIEVAGKLDPAKVSWLRRTHEAGYEVWVLVPLDDISPAHALLRGVVDRLQPWWIDQGQVQFGAPRIP